jgi:AcrR family transcriptional regulator
MGMSRPKAVGRREELLDAALLALAERGITGLRIRDVAEWAGVSTGTVHYHFNDIDELVLAIHELAVDRFGTSRRELVSAIPDACDRLIALAETGIPSTPDDPLVVTLYEIGIAHRRDRIHQSLLRSLYEQQVSLYASALEVGVAQGHFTLDANAWDLAAISVALEDSFGLHIITGNMPYSRARDLLVLNLTEITHCDELRIRGGIS